MIVVNITNTYVKSEAVQSSKKLNLTNVVGRDINIPVGGLNNSVVVYVIEVRTSNGDSWKLEKTYQDFSQLHSRIKTRFPAVSKIIKTFPKWKMFAPGIKSPQIDYRKKFFQAYLQALLQLKPRLGFVNDFLEVNQRANPQK